MTVIGVIDLPEVFTAEDIGHQFELLTNEGDEITLRFLESDPQCENLRIVSDRYGFDMHIQSTEEESIDLKALVISECDSLVCGPLDMLGRDDLLDLAVERGLHCVIIEE